METSTETPVHLISTSCGTSGINSGKKRPTNSGICIVFEGRQRLEEGKHDVANVQ